MTLFNAAEKSALEKWVKDLEETLATRNTEAEKAAKDATVREEQFMNRVAFLAQNVRGKHSLCLSCTSVFSLRNLFRSLFVFVLIPCRSRSHSCTDELFG